MQFCPEPAAAVEECDFVIRTHYPELFGHLPDFEVTYRILSAEEGRKNMPAYQGAHWNFMYDAYRDGLYMVYPEILDTKTREPIESAIPIPENGIAIMWILNPALRSLHKERIEAGTRGYFMEGGTKVAVCEVTQIIGLYQNPII